MSAQTSQLEKPDLSGLVAAKPATARVYSISRQVTRASERAAKKAQAFAEYRFRKRLPEPNWLTGPVYAVYARGKTYQPNGPREVARRVRQEATVTEKGSST